EIHTYNLAARCDTKDISTRLESKFSIPYAVSCVIMGLNMYDDYEENLKEIDDFINKIDVIHSLEITDMLPEKRAAKCIIINKDKQKFVSQTDNAQREYSNKFMDNQMTEKYMNMLQSYKEFDKKWLLSLKKIDREITFKSWLKNN